MNNNDKIRKNGRFRLIIQAISFAFSNGYINGWIKGKISTGQTKKVCFPGLNCYSCPGASFSCPIGALQAVLGDSGYKISLYVLGFIGLMGMLFGRLICGFICPFGLVQDLLYKIPVMKKIKSLPGHNILKYLKYVILVLFVMAFPIIFTDKTGSGAPWFCEYVCPEGTLFAGLPLIILNPELQNAIGWRFILKITILVLVIVLSIKSYRPFCKYLCPLGAVYSLTNPVSLYRYKVDMDKCIGCGKCSQVCNMSIDVCKTPNSPECIRCGKCKAVCPKEAITSSYKKMDKWNGIIIIVFIIVLALFLTYINVFETANADKLPDKKVENDINYFTDFSLKTFDGEEFNNYDFDEYNIVVVNIWEPYCVSCLDEMPDLNDIYKEYKTRGILIVGIQGNAYVYPEDTALGYEEIEKIKPEYPMLLADERFSKEVLPYLKNAFPGTWILDSKGNILGFTAGAKSKNEWMSYIESFIR